MDIRILGAHNRETSTSSCVSILIDDTLAVEAGGLASHLTAEEQKNIDSIVITHSHMDHIRDIPSIVLNSYRHGSSIDIYSTAYVCEKIREHLLNNEIFPEFQNIPVQKPTVCFQEIEPLALQWIDGHAILPVPVNHHTGTVGYQVSDKQDKTVFYSGDTGPGLAGCWKQIAPQLLIIDVTVPNSSESFARTAQHLTPALLQAELNSFREIKGYLPDVLAIHMDASSEAIIKTELKEVALNLNANINMAYEGMTIVI
jgi:ribonuclease BN (tRNA processing enzyme)